MDAVLGPAAEYYYKLALPRWNLYLAYERMNQQLQHGKFEEVDQKAIQDETSDFMRETEELDKINAAKADIRADIYSLGCTLYHILSGKPPFTGTHGEILMAHAQREAPTINLQRADVSPELGAVVARMMAKEMTKRFQTPSEVSAALEKFIGKGSTSKNYSNAAEPAPNTVTDLAASERDTSVEEPKPELSLDYAAESHLGKDLLQSIAEMMNRPQPTQIVSRKAIFHDGKVSPECSKDRAFALKNGMLVTSNDNDKLLFQMKSLTS